MAISSHISARFRSPRLLYRTLLVIVGTMGAVAAVVSAAVTYESRQRAANVAAERLEGSRRLLSALEGRRARDLVVQSVVVGSDPAVLAALERPTSEAGPAHTMLDAELDRLSEALSLDAIAVRATDGALLGSGGRHEPGWLTQTGSRGEGTTLGTNGTELIERGASGVFRVAVLPVKRGTSTIGHLYLATALDDGYAAELARLARVDVALVIGHQVLGSTVAPAIRSGLATRVGDLPETGVVDLAGSREAIKCGLYLGPVRFYVMVPVDTPGTALSVSATMLALVGSGLLAFGGVAGLVLTRSVTTPIDRLARHLLQMARTRDFSRQLRAAGSGPELESLVETVNQMLAALASAESHREQAYVGAIKALAAALDCRDPYTAGHSERVSTLSVMIGRHMGVDAENLEVLRLGALLHDIGKIGIRDNVLTKAGPLTPDEFDTIKMHPTLGAHILRQVPFLHRHLPIVELHHERPDGRGYPHGLIGNATPLLARIVHVADAFDAMTSTRAYRPAQQPGHAIAELWHYAGSQFDAEIVEAFVSAWTSAVAATEGSGNRDAALRVLSAAQPTGTEG